MWNNVFEEHVINMYMMVLSVALHLNQMASTCLFSYHEMFGSIIDTKNNLLTEYDYKTHIMRISSNIYFK